MTDSAQPSESTDLPERAVSVDEATPMPSPSAAAAPPSFTVSVPALQTATGGQATPHSGRTVADAAAPGARLFGSYVLLQEIAEGGMGVVYRARHIELGREVALKMIRGSLQLKPSLIDRFYQEARAVALLKHPHIIQLFDYGIVDGQHFFTMYFAEGGSLYKHLERFQAHPRLAVALLEKVARAVQHIHEHGVLHRDLKPANILLDGNDEPLVSDFGLAKSLEAELDLTRSGSALGTPAYMSPEQAAGKGELVSPKTDVWALGVILYEVLCGQKPFVGQSREEVIRAIQESEPSMPRSHAPRLDRSLEAIVQKCLEKEPSRRYPSAGALADDLGAWLRGEPVRARPMGRLRRGWRWVRKHPTMMGLGAMAIVVAATALIVWDRVDPDRELRIMERRLANRETIEITTPQGLAWHRWRLPGAFAAGSEPGTAAVQSTALTLLEVVRDPMWESYTIRAEVQHHSLVHDGEVGIYLGHQEYESAGQKFHGFLALTFVDHGRLANIKECQKVALTPYLSKASVVMFVQQRVAPALVKDIVPFSAFKKSDWRRLAISVTPEDLSVFWDDEPLGKETWSSLNKNAKDLITLNAVGNPEYARGIPFRFSPRFGIGFYVNKGQASYRNVVLRPL